MNSTICLQYSLDKSFLQIAPTFKLWSLFRYFELIENMRQREDLDYAQLLARVRIQQATDCDVELLRSRIIPAELQGGYEALAGYYTDLQRDDARVMALFPTNEEGIAFNEAVMGTLGLAVVCAYTFIPFTSFVLFGIPASARD